SARRHRGAPAWDRAVRRAPCGASPCCKASAAWLGRSRLCLAGPRDRTPRPAARPSIPHNGYVHLLLRFAASAANLQQMLARRLQNPSTLFRTNASGVSELLAPAGARLGNLHGVCHIKEANLG